MENQNTLRKINYLNSDLALHIFLQLLTPLGLDLILSKSLIKSKTFETDFLPLLINQSPFGAFKLSTEFDISSISVTLNSKLFSKIYT